MSGRKGYICMCAFLCIFLSSCVIGKKYTRPDLNLPDMESSELKDEQLLMDIAWWELYADPYLQALIEKAIEQNKDMKIAAGKIRELAYVKGINNANLLPQTNLSLRGDREWEHYEGAEKNVDSQFDAKLMFAWELDLFGNLRWARRQGIADYLQSVEARRALQMSLMAEVASAYMELVALDNELKIIRQTLETRKEGVKQAKLRFEGGLTSETAYQQAQVEFANTATLIPELNRRIAAKENEIAFLCGDYPREIFRNDSVRLKELPEEFTANLSSVLLKRRPDVLAAEQALIAANAKVGMAYTDRFPRIQLTGAYGFENDQLKTLLNSPYGLITGGLTAPLFSFHAKKNKYKALQAAYEQETARYEKVVLRVFHEANNAIMAYSTARRARERKNELEQASRKYVDLAQLQYINGVINYLDVLDAQRRYFDAQIGLSNAVRDEYLAIVELYKALGGGWSLDVK